jgi:hypothetical protein
MSCKEGNQESGFRCGKPGRDLSRRYGTTFLLSLSVVTFHEDEARLRVVNSAENFSILR